MDVLVLPSWREGFPNAVLEAAASGVPVVAANCTGSSDAVVPGVTGLLVPPGEPRAILEAVTNLLDNLDLRRAMAKAAREWVVEAYDNRRVLGNTVALYSDLIRAAAEREEPGAEAIGERATDLFVSR